MSNVLEFRRPEPPTLAGEAVCVGCGSSWAAVAPVGTAWLECPVCGSNRGTWKHPVHPAPGDMIFRCCCGGEALTALKKGGLTYLRCLGCGCDQTNAVFD